jgi:signal transduction histidine kinase
MYVKGDIDPLKKILPSWMINGGFIDDVKDKLAGIENELKVCIYIYAYLYMDICVCICICVYVYMCICFCMCGGFVDDVKDKLAGIESELKVFIYVYMHICIFMYICMYICICMYVCIYVYMFIYI